MRVANETKIQKDLNRLNNWQNRVNTNQKTKAETRQKSI